MKDAISKAVNDLYGGWSKIGEKSVTFINRRKNKKMKKNGTENKIILSSSIMKSALDGQKPRSETLP